ncbi:MAG: photosynthetic reaction center cytochrome c subunit family protein [Vicinamibacterales bacterium]
MRCGWRGRIVWATGAVSVCLFGIATAVSLSAAAPAQVSQAGPDPASLMAENHFKNIQVLKGMPIDTFIEAMGMFAASMGGDCTYCHSKDAVFNRDAFSVATPRIQRARQMIVMMRNLNNNNFGGALKVTCFTCHRGSYVPETAPRLALQYGTPDEDPNVMSFVADTSVPATQILDRYIEALGGAGRLAKISSFVAKGTYAGFDTGFAEVPVEIFAKAPNQRTTIVHLDYGQNVRVYDGRNGWFAGPDSPAPLVTLTTGTLDLARMEALVAFPAGIKQAFSQWVVGSSIIDDQEVQIVQGTTAGLLPVNLYFDKSGLLVRLVRWNQTGVGPVPTQIDYADYREVAGVKMPFTWTVSQTYMQMTITLRELQPNVAIDPGRFAKPAPAAR